MPARLLSVVRQQHQEQPLRRLRLKVRLPRPGQPTVACWAPPLALLPLLPLLPLPPLPAATRGPHLRPLGRSLRTRTAAACTTVSGALACCAARVFA